MSSRPVVAAPRHSVVAISAVALIVALLVTVVVAVAADWSPARADSSYEVVVVGGLLLAEGREALRDLRPRLVAGRARVVRARRWTSPRSRRKATAPLAVMRRKVKGSTWRLESTIRTRRATGSEFSVVFWHRNSDNYAYLHLDREPGASGVYRVRDGHTTRVSRVTATVTPGSRTGRRAPPRRPGDQGVRRTRRLDPGLRRWHIGRRRELPPRRVRELGLLHPCPRPHRLRPGGHRVDRQPADDHAYDAVTQRQPTATPPPGGRAVAVSTSAQLTAALADALPGDVITMADGTYTSKGLAAGLVIGGKSYYGTFVLERSGTARRRSSCRAPARQSSTESPERSGRAPSTGSTSRTPTMSPSRGSPSPT